MSSTMTEPTTAPAVLSGVRERLAGLLEVLWAARSPRELLDRVAELEKARSVLDAVELTVVAEIEATAAGRTMGWSSTKQFLEAVCGDFQGTGRAAVRLAEAPAGECGGVREELAGGFICRRQAEVIVGAVRRLPVKRVVREQAIEVLLELARTVDASELKKAARYLVEVVDPDGVARDEERKLDEKERAAPGAVPVPGRGRDGWGADPWPGHRGGGRGHQERVAVAVRAGDHRPGCLRRPRHVCRGRLCPRRP